MAPTVTVAIPLHGSARWVENVAANIRALPPMVNEIIVSDQTCVDDAADRLRALTADDPRVVVHSRRAGLTFAEHYQLLLEMGAGELFMWMPHDDIFDSGWVPVLADALARHPRAWLAFGQVRHVEIDGVTPAAGFSRRTFPFPPGEIAGVEALRMMLGDRAHVAFRGLCRRQNVVTAGILMDPDTSLASIDTEWVFTVALLSALVYDDRAVTWKRRYSGSSHTLPEWRQQARGRLDQAAVALIARHGPGGLTGLALRSRARCSGLLPGWRSRMSSLVPARGKHVARRISTYFTR